MKNQKTGHNPNIKKLSTALRRGAKMAKERGIKRITGELFKYNSKNEICGACALGMGVIAKYGVEGANAIRGESDFIRRLEKKVNTYNTCLPKVVSKKVRANSLSESTEVLPEYFVTSLNDVSKKSVEEIASYLEKCGL